ncbi:hypothetical protein M0811_05428 [Anaeramoeba ignava]|uniref:Uncharacterized protein n=1 Tax=Anaeramoeba ignava TaxID=1746090 RepID=A0A9Q0LVP5_ANAIG|nr:hypothetical protein M0811_05428 [Anaeramoeba ignava]
MKQNFAQESLHDNRSWFALFIISTKSKICDNILDEHKTKKEQTNYDEEQYIERQQRRRKITKTKKEQR